MQKKYFIHGLPASAKDCEVAAFFSLFGSVASIRRCPGQPVDVLSNDWFVEMRTNEGARTLVMLNGEGFAATAIRRRRY